MNTRNNHLHQETDRRLRQTLLDYLNRDREPTVGQLCGTAGINRSTFYRHYRDIFDLMEQTEKEIQQGLVSVLRIETSGREMELRQEQLLAMIRYIKENRHFYRMYMKTHSGLGMEQSFQSIWEREIKPLFLRNGVYDETRMLYYYEYIKAGIMVVLRRWIERDCAESEEDLADMLWRMLRNK